MCSWGSEALETFRALDRCHPGSLVVTNTGALVPYPVAIGKAAYPEVSRMLDLMAAQVGSLLAFDAGDLARQAGSPLAVNMVLLGALGSTGILPFPQEASWPWSAAKPTPSSWKRTWPPSRWGRRPRTIPKTGTSL